MYIASARLRDYHSLKSGGLVAINLHHWDSDGGDLLLKTVLFTPRPHQKKFLSSWNNKLILIIYQQSLKCKLEVSTLANRTYLLFIFMLHFLNHPSHLKTVINGQTIQSLFLYFVWRNLLHMIYWFHGSGCCRKLWFSLCQENRKAYVQSSCCHILWIGWRKWGK